MAVTFNLHYFDDKDRFDLPLTSIPNAQRTPHIAGNTTTSVRTASRQIVDKINELSAAAVH